MDFGWTLHLDIIKLISNDCTFGYNITVMGDCEFRFFFLHNCCVVIVNFDKAVELILI